jgi:hypothetical protein
LYRTIVRVNDAEFKRAHSLPGYDFGMTSQAFSHRSATEGSESAAAPSARSCGARAFVDEVVLDRSDELSPSFPNSPAKFVPPCPCALNAGSDRG